MARVCWENMRKRAKERKMVGEWEKERRDYYKEKGWSIREVEDLRNSGEL